ncbi:MAG: hypothetical protein ABIQ90_05880 [Polaromonas sp.]
MTTVPRPDASTDDKPQWKSLDYRGKQIHVRAALRAAQAEELQGHGQQWDFKVKVTDSGAGPMGEPLASAESDPGIFYSTQAITEDLGFAKGRELVDGV